MIKTTIDYCERNASAWSGIGAFGGILAQVKAKKQEIDQLNQVALGKTKGVTEDTKLKRTRMTTLAVKCGGATLAFANLTGNNTLAAKVKFSENRLNKMRKEAVMTACQGIHDAANANMAGVQTCGLTAQDVADLQSAITDYRQKSPAPRLAVVQNREAKRRITVAVREVMEHLLEGQLDHLVDTLWLTNENFCTGYDMAREIIDLGTVHTKVKGSVKDVMDVPLEGVKFSVYETGTQKLLRQTVTVRNGTFKVSPMPVGNFDFRWEKEGFATRLEENVRVGAGKVVRRSVVMKVV
jgi:hypothetical protein